MTDTTDRIAEIRERADAATGESWELGELIRGVYEVCETGNYVWGSVCVPHMENNAKFIAHSRADIPWLLDQIAERDAEIKRIRMTAAEALEHIEDSDDTGAYLILKELGDE